MIFAMEISYAALIWVY